MFRVVIVRGVEAREIYQRDIGLLRPADLDQDSIIVDKLLARAPGQSRVLCSFDCVFHLGAFLASRLWADGHKLWQNGQDSS